MTRIPRPEYPRPQFVRPGWMNLNGPWQFEIDAGRTGRARGLTDEPLSGEILVPFCPESRLSGVAHTDFMACVWYRRSFTLPEEAQGKRVLLHFGAVDYRTEVWINGQSVGVHEGGYVSFSFDITSALRAGENTVVVCAEDDTRSPLQPTGKQCDQYASYGCLYTRTTGIWQTVWLEWVNPQYIASVKLTPDAPNRMLYIEAEVSGDMQGVTLTAAARFEDRDCGSVCASGRCGIIRAALPLTEEHLWNVGEPNLYDLKLTLEKDGEALDALDSYFGLRTVGFDGKRFTINGRAVFMRLVLDQGFYPDGIYTAPTDADLKRDIELSLAMGFNGARLHEKVFEARYLYWADHLGYLCWGEMANWGLDHSRPDALAPFLKEWLQAVKRDYSAPSIIGWCPFNETWDQNGHRQCDDVLRCVYRATKALDSSRPVIDTSGNFHVETDIFDVHDYEQKPEVFSEHYRAGTSPIWDRFSDRQPYGGQPVFVSEYGGIWWKPEGGEGWGYGDRPASEQEFLDRYRGLTEVLLNNPDHCGFCYTQLTDVEQEVNGLYTYGRRPKFDPAVIAAVNRQTAACEKGE